MRYFIIWRWKRAPFCPIIVRTVPLFPVDIARVHTSTLLGDDGHGIGWLVLLLKNEAKWI